MEKGNNMGVIGKRAAKAIRARASLKNTFYGFELDRLQLTRQSLYQWEHGKGDPFADALARMANAGYDVVYILTGKENKNA